MGLCVYKSEPRIGLPSIHNLDSASIHLIQSTSIHLIQSASIHLGSDIPAHCNTLGFQNSLDSGNHSWVWFISTLCSREYNISV